MQIFIDFNLVTCGQCMTERGRSREDQIYQEHEENN